MKTRKFNFRTISALLLVGAVLASVAFISAALAAPGAALSEKIQAAPMAALTEVTCSLVDTTRTCELWSLEGDLTMPDGEIVPVWGFAGKDALGNPPDTAQVPGPLIRANVGETVEIVVHNQIPGENIALAFPGQEWIPELEIVATVGNPATFSFDAQQNGAFLYEAGLTPGGARQVAMGLYGAMVIGTQTAADQEEILVFSELDPAFNANPAGFAIYDYKPEYWLINGQPYPDTGTINVNAGSTVLLRYLNAGVGHHAISLLGLDQQIVAMDGEPLEVPCGAVSEPLIPGETKDALVSVPVVPDGTLYALYNASLHQHNNNQRLPDGRTAFGGMLTFLQVVGEPPPTGAGPVVSNVTVSPQKTDGTEDVSLSATLTDADLNVTAYDYYVDQPGTLPGTGSPTTPGLTVEVSVLFSAAQVDTLQHGEHVFYIRGQDSAGNWGALGSAVLSLDKAGPDVTAINLNPNPTNGSMDVFLNATADDRGSGDSLVVDAQYSTDNGANWVLMSLSTTGTSLTAVTAAIPAQVVTDLGEGSHPVWVQAQDEWENWSDPVGVINLLVDLTGPNVPTVTLDPNTLDFNQPLPVTSVRLDATVADSISTLENAEGFINNQGAPGTGFDLYPADGQFNELIEDAYYYIPVSHFATLLPGDHQVLVVGKDQAGNWGEAGSATITLVAQGVDATGPTISGLTADPNPTGGARKVSLSAVATDTQSNIVSAVWFLGTDTANAKTNRMSASDGRFDSLSEAIEASINVGKWDPGSYQVSVTAIDDAGNWGPIQTITLVIE